MDPESAQKCLKKMSPDEVRICVARKKLSFKDNVIFRAHYLAHLCALGDYNVILGTLNAFSVDKVELEQIMNYRIRVMNGNVPVYEGTLLHIALYWNTDQKAIDLYDLLTTYGAKLSRNYYGEYPWMQSGDNWINPLTCESYGERDDSDFDDIYDDMIEIYNLKPYASKWV